jgi:hypothetical protein
VVSKAVALDWFHFESLRDSFVTIIPIDNPLNYYQWKVPTFLLTRWTGSTYKREQQLKAAGENGSLPQLRGDVIRTKLNGSVGMIYWTGAKYAWHPFS